MIATIGCTSGSSDASPERANPSEELRPARMHACTAKGSKDDESAVPRAVRESVVPEASIGGLAKNSRARPRSDSERARGGGKVRGGGGVEKMGETERIR